MSTREIKSDLNLSCCPTTVCNRLRSDPNTSFGRHKSKPKLTSQHKQARLAFASNQIINDRSYWENVIWSDEKKWSLDGPDGLRSYWHDLRSERTIFSKRHSGGGKIMTWAGFSANGCLPIAFISHRMNASTYQDILAEYLLPEAPLITSGSYIFMQDNAPIHRAASTKAWLSANEVAIMDWPALSPDLNPIENLWGWLARKVYAHGAQFSTVTELKNAIVREWAEVPISLTQTLARSVPNRLLKVISKNGNSIDY